LSNVIVIFDLMVIVVINVGVNNGESAEEGLTTTRDD
jgi:hypothetical protein